MAIFNHDHLPELTMREGILGKFLSHQELGATGCSLLVNTVEPGVDVPLHKHTVEETMLVLEGVVWVKLGTERTTVGKNHTVIIPADMPHAWGNDGHKIAKLLWAFAGPDPFKDAIYLEGEPPTHRVD